MSYYCQTSIDLFSDRCALYIRGKVIMVRNLYRFYLYTVFIALLVFTAVVTEKLLDTLLTHTPL
jgi:hypothetical protein